ncbi:MAG: hypothetical protein ACHQF2_00820, partial [Flavobacteriales bacterium]
FNHDEMRQYLKEINPAFLDKVVIHSHYALADEFGLAGVHYTADYRKSVKPGALYDHRHDWHEKRKTLSTSFHSADIFSSSALFDYVFYSPVANCISKKDKSAVDPLQMIIDLSFIKTDVIALGGICPDIMKMMDMNLFHGVAALGWIWDKGNNPAKQFNLLKETCLATALT